MKRRLTSAKNRLSLRLSFLLIGGRFSFSELLDLAASDRADADEHLKTVFEWYYARSVASVRGALASAATIIVAFFVAGLDAEAHIRAEHIGPGAGVITLLVLAALWSNWQLSHLQREFLVCVRLVHELRKFQSELTAHLARTGGADVS